MEFFGSGVDTPQTLTFVMWWTLSTTHRSDISKFVQIDIKRFLGATEVSGKDLKDHYQLHRLFFPSDPAELSSKTFPGPLLLPLFFSPMQHHSRAWNIVVDSTFLTRETRWQDEKNKNHGCQGHRKILSRSAVWLFLRLSASRPTARRAQTRDVWQNRDMGESKVQR